MAYFNASNVFASWDLNPLAAATGIPRDTLAADRDAFIEPLMAAYRDAAARYGFPADEGDYNLFFDGNFRAFVQTGALPIPSPSTSAPAAAAPTSTQSEFIEPSSSPPASTSSSGTGAADLGTLVIHGLTLGTAPGGGMAPGGAGGAGQTSVRVLAAAAPGSVTPFRVTASSRSAAGLDWWKVAAIVAVAILVFRR